jgi:SET domain-containing protein
MGLIIRSSAIHAAGCYTTTAVARDTRVVEYTGPRISKDAADKLYAQKPYTYLFGVGDGTTVIDGHGIAMFINHSCDPNCETEEDDDGRVWIRSIRDGRWTRLSRSFAMSSGCRWLEAPTCTWA